MTEPIFPDRLADELLAGAADPSSLSPEVRGVAEVVAAAQQAPVADELAGMSAAVAAFQGIVTVPVSAPGSPEPSRRVAHMFSSRIPKRAAIITAATLLMAGTAAAAAGGVLPTPFHGPVLEDVSGTTETTTAGTDTTAPDTTSPDTTAVGSETSAPDTTTGGSDTTGVEDTTESTDATETTVYPGRDYGLCTAWTHGAEKKLNPAFQYLADQAAADAAAGAPTDTATDASEPSEDEIRAGVDTYCDKVIADKKGDAADDESDDTDATDADEVENTVDGVQHGNSGQHGHGNGKGNGKGHGKP